jgi:hypothetical protein
MGPTEFDATVVDPPPPQPTSAAERGGDPSLADLAKDTTHYVRAWGVLVAGEVALARINLLRLLLLALFVPAIAIGIVLGLEGVLAGLLYRLVPNWTLVMGAVALINLGLLVGVLILLRHWWRSLSLPRSREALTRLWRDQDDNGTHGKDTNPQRPN